MLDLLVFCFAAAIIYRRDGVGDKQNLHLIQRATHYLFQSCLFLSLILFSLAILEVAPLTWMVLIYRSSILICWYRTLLWLICVLLLVIHPICLALAMHPQTISSTSSLSLRSSPSSPSCLAQFNTRSRVTIAVQLIWTVIRFFFVGIIWRFFRQITRMVLPVDFENNDDADNDDNDNNRARGEGGTTRQLNWMQHCSFSAIALSSMFIFVTFVSLGAMRKVIITSSNTNLDFEHKYASIEEDKQQSSSPLKSMVTMICSFGLIVASILNGFGCASLPHSNLVGFFLAPTPLTTVTKAENDCYYAKSQLKEKQCLLTDIIQSAANRRSSSSSSFTSSLPQTINAAEKKKILQLQDEVKFLRNLVEDMVDDIHEMKQSQQLAQRARTIIGRIKVFFGIIFSIVLVVRVVLAAKSFSLLLEEKQQAPPMDPVTSILLWLIGNNIVSEDQYNDLAQGTSLVLAGVLIASQVSSFLRVVNALGRKLNRMLGLSCGMLHENKTVHLPVSSVANILASYVMGSYFLSCVVVVKMNLPVAYRASFSSAVGFNFDFNTNLLNAVFFTASITSALILGLLFGIQRNHSARYQLESQLNTTLGGVSV